MLFQKLISLCTVNDMLEVIYLQKTHLSCVVVMLFAVFSTYLYRGIQSMFGGDNSDIGQM